MKYSSDTMQVQFSSVQCGDRCLGVGRLLVEMWACSASWFAPEALAPVGRVFVGLAATGCACCPRRLWGSRLLLAASPRLFAGRELSIVRGGAVCWPIGRVVLLRAVLDPGLGLCRLCHVLYGETEATETERRNSDSNTI